MTDAPATNELLALADLRRANVTRQKEWDVFDQLTLAYRGNELAGEVGEACNVIKKLERQRLGIKGSRDTVEHLAEELADIIICTDLIAMQTGIDLSSAVIAKFNASSEKVGLKTRLSALEAPASGDGEPVAWMAYCPETGGRCLAYTQSRAHDDGREAYSPQHEYVVVPLYTAPPADAGMREALENVRGFLDTPVGRRRFVGDPFYDEVIASIRKAPTAPGATTKSDGGGGRARDFSTVAIDENFYFTWPKDGANEVPVQDSGGTQGKSNAALVASVDANANDDGQRVQTGNNVVTGGESATTNSSPSEPKNYFFETEEEAAEAADNGRNTGGKSYYRPSDPSSTRSEVMVEGIARAMVHAVYPNSIRDKWFERDPVDLGSDRFSTVALAGEYARALLDQFEIRRK